MHPSTLSAADFDCGMYVHVLCPSQNPLLSRIWVHLPHLEEIGGHMLSRIWTHLVHLAPFSVRPLCSASYAIISPTTQIQGGIAHVSTDSTTA